MRAWGVRSRAQEIPGVLQVFGYGPGRGRIREKLFVVPGCALQIAAQLGSAARAIKTVEAIRTARERGFVLRLCIRGLARKNSEQDIATALTEVFRIM